MYTARFLSLFFLSLVVVVFSSLALASRAIAATAPPCYTNYPQNCTPGDNPDCNPGQSLCDGRNDSGEFCRACVTRSTTTSQTCSSQTGRADPPCSTRQLWQQYGEYGVNCKNLGAECSNRYSDGCYGCAAPVCNENGEYDPDNGETGIDCGGGGCPPCPVAPAVSLDVNGSSAISVDTGQQYTLHWTASNDPSSCSAELDWAGENLAGVSGYPGSGSVGKTSTVARTYNYRLSCTNSGGTGTSNTVSVTVNPCTATTCTPNAGQPSCGNVPGTDNCSNSCTATQPTCSPPTSTTPWTCSVWSTEGDRGTAGGACNANEYCVELGGTYDPSNAVTWPARQDWSWGSNLTPTRTFKSWPYASNGSTYNVSVNMTAVDNSGSGTTVPCTAKTVTVPDRSGSGGGGTIPTPGPGNLKCLSCGGDRWYWGLNCAKLGPQDVNCASSCSERSDPNRYPAVEDQYCYLSQPQPNPDNVIPGSASIHGKWKKRLSDGTLVDLTLPYSFYSVYGGSCPNLRCSAVNQNEYDANAPYSAQDQVYVGMLEWPRNYSLIGYIKGQVSRCKRSELRNQDDPNSGECVEYICKQYSSGMYDFGNWDPGYPEVVWYGGSYGATKYTSDYIASNWSSTQGNNPTNVTTCTANVARAAVDFIFEVEPKYSISGNVFNDYDCDGRKDSEDTNYGGARVRVVGGSTDEIKTSDSSGNYTSSALTKSQNYSVDVEVPSGHRISTTDPLSYPNLNNNVTNADFGFCPTASAWFQTRDSDILSSGNMNSSIPRQCIQQLDSCSPYLSLNGDGGYPGVPVYNGTLSLGWGTVGSNTSPSPYGWNANTRYTGRAYTYASFAAKMPTSAVTTPDTISSGGYFGSNGTPDSKGYKWFKADGNLTLDGEVNLNNEKVVLFVPGNLTINNRVRLRKGEGFFAVFVGGEISISPEVTYQAQPAPKNGSQPGLEGMFFADGNIKTGTRSTTTPVNDDQLFVRGALVSKSSVLLQRDLDPAKSGTGNNTTPAEFVEYAPDLIFNFPSALMREGVIWEEVAP